MSTSGFSMTESTDTFLDRVQNLVESEDFFDKLVAEINLIDNSNNKAKLLMELISYVSPKMKTQEPNVGKQGQAISILFTDAVEPPRDSERDIINDRDTHTPLPEELPTD